MPKQVYVYPGNINDADTIEGLRTVLEPAVDAVYTFDESAGNYVDVNDNTVHFSDTVYLQRNGILSARLHKHHYTGAITDNNGNEVMLVVIGGTYSRHYGLIKEDPTQSTGYSLLTTGDTDSYTTRFYQDVHIKPLWDNTDQTIFIAIYDAVFWDVDSNQRNRSVARAVALVKYDKNAETLSVVQEITDSVILRSYPISEIMFYYDSANDTWIFYQPRLGYNGTLTMRKITATQTSVSTVAETIALSGASFTPKFPDGLSDPMYYYTRSGLSLQRGWVELSALLDANSDNFTIAIPDSPNIDTSTSIAELVAEEQLKFLRGTWSYSSGTWTFSVASEIVVDAPGKQVLNKTAKLLNNKAAPLIFAFIEPPGGTDYTYLEYVQLEKISDVSAITDISVNIYAKKRVYNQNDFNNKVRGTYDTNGNLVIFDTMPESSAVGYANMLAPIQIDSVNEPAILLYHKASGGGTVLLKINTTQKVNLAPLALKYIYDISSLSTSGNKYYLINRIQNSRLASYVYRAHDLPGSTKKVLIVHDVDAGSADFSSLGLMALSYSYSVGGAELNYAGGGTITAIYQRSGATLKRLVFWIRSGASMYSPFMVFSAQLNNESLLKYITNNTNVDPIFVAKSGLQNNAALYLASPLSSFYDTAGWSSSGDTLVPNPSAGRIWMRAAGNNIWDYASHGYSVYYNPATDEMLIDNDETGSSLVLSSFALHLTTQSPGTQNYDRHTRYFVSADGIGAVVFPDYFLQVFRNYWSADYEDTLEISVGSSVYKYVIVGKVYLDNVEKVIVVLEDVA